jgi:hypothetical protein
MNLEKAFIKLSLEPTVVTQSAGANTHYNMVKAILDTCPLRLLGLELLLYFSQQFAVLFDLAFQLRGPWISVRH